MTTRNRLQLVDESLKCARNAADLLERGYCEEYAADARTYATLAVAYATAAAALPMPPGDWEDGEYV